MSGLQLALMVLGGGGVMAGAVWLYMQVKASGRLEREAEALRADKALLEEENAILKKQRDHGIHSVADADRLWDSIDKT